MVNDLNARLDANPPRERRTHFRSTPILDESNLNPTQVDGAVYTPDTTVHLSTEIPLPGDLALRMFPTKYSCQHEGQCLSRPPSKE